MALEQRVSWFKKKALWKQEGSWYSSKAQQLWHNPKQNPASSQLLQYFASVDKNTGILISFNVFLLSTGYGRIIKVIIKLSVKGQSGTMRNNIGISGLCTAVFFCCIGYGRCLPVGMEQNSGPLSDDYQLVKFLDMQLQCGLPNFHHLCCPRKWKCSWFAHSWILFSYLK